MDSATGYAIQPEHISIRSHGFDAGEKLPQTLHSDNGGRASVQLERGRYTIAVSSPNHEPMSVEFEANQNRSSRMQFMLDPIQKPLELQVEQIEALHRVGETLIQGFIVDDHTGEPLPNVRVISSASRTAAVTDARGFFRFHVPVPAAQHLEPTNLTLEKPGYRTEERRYLELWSRGDLTYCIRLERGSGRQVVDERGLRRREGGVGEPLDLENNFEKSISYAAESTMEEPGVPDASPATFNPATSEPVVMAATTPANSTVRVPRNIRVDKVGTLHYVSMDYYVKHVLPAEWISSWHTNSLNSGAVAIRSYAIARMNNSGSNSSSDICGTSTCQVFNPTLTTTRTDRAVEFTEDYVMVNNSGNISSTEYSAENNGPNNDCGDGFTAPTGGCLYDPICIGQSRSGHGRGLCQRGSNRWANGSRGYSQRDWIWILEHYYPNLRLFKGAPLVVGDDVKSRSSNCNVRACPGGGIESGVSCALITTKASGQTGVIIGGPVRITEDDKGFTWYQIQWNDGSSTTGWSCENYIERVFPAPTAPTGLSAAAVSTSQINLAWTDTSDVETSFEIERAPAASGPWIEIARVAANETTYSDGNLFSASTWFYRVRARNAGGATSYTTIATATTHGAVAPTLAAIPNRTISQGATFTFTAAATAPERMQLITDFEPFMSETANGVVLFQMPTNSSTTRNFINSAVNVGTNNVAAVTDNYPVIGYTPGKVLLVTCQFTNASNPWLRLTTEGTATLPNPVIDFTKKLRFNIRSDRDIRVAIGCRETTTATGTAIGANGGITGPIEWVGATNVAGTAPVPSRVIISNSWTTLTFDFKNEPIRNFSGGNGILSTASGLGVLEHLAIVPAGGTGVYNIYVDSFVVVGIPGFTYSLGPNAPSGASIHPVTGVFSWTPTQSQSPSTNLISVIATDDTLQALSATNTFTVVVQNSVPNSPPMLAPISNRTINAGRTVTATAEAFDPNPGDTLTFSLGTGAPAGASVNAVTGVFTWTPGDADINTTRTITMQVTDDGSPSLSGSTSFDVVVLPRNNPPLISPVSNRSVHIGSSIVLTNTAFDFNSGDVLTFSLDPGAPTDAIINPTTGVFVWTPGAAAANSVNSITVRVTDNGFPPLSGSTTFNVAVAPTLETDSISISDNTITFTWSALAGVTYRIEYKSNLSDANWTLLAQVTPADSAGTFSEEISESNPQRFYRVVKD
ncbi:MAG: hypothetical protein H0X66_00155 [Verrucomicrobia bacterium]|nr:hypothetical protein [Verrucomicrobiota bacterium]